MHICQFLYVICPVYSRFPAFILSKELLCCNLRSFTSRQTSNISCTKFQKLHVSRLVLQLPLLNPLKPGVDNEDVVGAAPTGV